MKARILSAAMLALMALPVTAKEPMAHEAAQIDLMPGWQTPGGQRMMAVRIRLAPGWHTYWRAPGDAGIPPQLNWTASENIADAKFHWPIPKLFSQNGMRYVGYDDDVILPLEISPRSDGVIHLDATLDIGVCDDICVPLHAQLKAEIAPSAVGQGVADIRAALKDVPRGVSGAECDIAPIDDGVRITARLATGALGTDEFAVMELPDKLIWISEAEVTRAGPTLSVSSDFVPENAQPFFVDRQSVSITVFGGGKAVEAKGC